MSQVHTQWVNHRFRGGWATDFGPTLWSTPQGSNMDIPFLVEAKNLIYELDGGCRTMPGTTALNTTTLGASSVVTGIYDYWRQGATGSPTQRIVANVDTRIVAAQLSDGVFSTIKTGLVDGAVPSYETFDDLLIISSDATADVPMSWDQTTFQNLAGSPPNFSFCKTYKNRVWGAGVAANPSRLYYSVNLDPEDWAGATSGSIDIDPSDGDAIVGLASFRNELWVFKGPYKGSIHRITGSSPSDFARTTFIRGITAAYHNSIFNLPNDLGFVSPRGTVHSLVATQNFGDYEQSTLSLPINKRLRETVSTTYYKQWWAVEDQINGRVLIGYTSSGQTRNTRLLAMDYRFIGLGEPFSRWSEWTAYGADSLALVVDMGNEPNVFVGVDDGVGYKTNQATRQHKNSALSPVITTPMMTYGTDHMLKNLYSVGIELAPKSAQSFTVSWLRDGNVTQSTTLTQGGGDVLGPWPSNVFTLDSSVLGGSRYVTRYAQLEESGEFRAISYSITDTGVNSEIEIHGLLTATQSGGLSTENA